MKLFKINYTIDPLEEASGEVTKALKADRKAAKAVESYVFKEAVELDERKWDDKELNDTIKAFIRYDLKLLSVQLAEVVKDEKGPSLGTETDKLMKRFKADLDKKLLRGFDELKTDAGPNKKAYKDLKAALKGLSQDVPANLFSSHVRGVLPLVESIERVNAAAKSGGKDDKDAKDGKKDAQAQRKDELASELRALEKVTAKFAKAAKPAEQSVQSILTVAKGMKTTKGLDESISKIAAIVRSKEHIFEKFIEKCRAFEKECAALKSPLGGSEIKANELKSIRDALEKLESADAHALTIGRMASSLVAGAQKAAVNLNLKK